MSHIIWPIFSILKSISPHINSWDNLQQNYFKYDVIFAANKFNSHLFSLCVIAHSFYVIHLLLSFQSMPQTVVESMKDISISIELIETLHIHSEY